jgi:hypothetical protein
MFQPVLEEVWKWLQGEWGMIAATPVSFALCVLLFSASIAYLTYSYLSHRYEERYSERLATMQATIDFQAAQLAQSQIGPRSPSVERNLKPDLKISLLGGHVFVPDNPHINPLTGIALDTRVWNVGAPSVATEWRLIVIPAGHMPVIGKYTEMAGDIRASGERDSAVIRVSDALHAKTNLEPISETPLSGVLVFFVNLDKATVLREDTILELSVHDIFGKETVRRQRMGDW